MWRSSTMARGDPEPGPTAATRSSTPVVGRSLSSAVVLTKGSGSGGSMAMSPSASGASIRGSGAHGVWLETRSTSAISGARGPGVSSRCARVARVNWSGTGAYPNFGPR